MIVELFPFQQNACRALRDEVEDALSSYQRRCVPQVISFTAPTGAGKTIIMSALIEDILFGNEQYIEKPNAIFIWLSDSPQLNEQSKTKIETKADNIRIGQCVTIEDGSFDRELLEDGHIYFLNTQKLGKNSNLTKHSDSRQHTIWETLANTVEQKSDRLYFIIDEAHRGAQGRDAATATTIMQKFVKGSSKDGIPPMPLIIGMSATTRRFDALIGETTSTIRRYVVTADEVRSSGLLKDRIIIKYPESSVAGNELAILQAAATEWKDKWEHWGQYCREQHYAYVNPIFVVQVLSGTDNIISHTNLDDCLSTIEEHTGFRFKTGEVVHTFVQTTSALLVNGLEVKYVEPSQITDDRNIKVVFFKENLSTGWDCPRAETMMSFRRATDVTYIAQLLGRMVRTPMQMHIMVDESLNDVHLYLPHFDEDTVNEVVEELQNSEGGEIPTEIVSESSNTSTERWTTGTISTPSETSGESSRTQSTQEPERDSQTQQEDVGKQEEQKEQGGSETGIADSPIMPVTPTITSTSSSTSSSADQTLSRSTSSKPHFSPEAEITKKIDRDGILKFINNSGLLTYNVRKVQITKYLPSLYKLVHLLARSEMLKTAISDVHSDIVDMIYNYVKELKNAGKYEELATQVKLFELKTQIIDPFGEKIDNDSGELMLAVSSDDIERQFRNAESRLGNDGVGMAYGNKYGDLFNPNEFMIDVILFSADSHNLELLEEYAKTKFHNLNDTYRPMFATIESEEVRKDYDKIVNNGDIISKHNFRIPEVVISSSQNDGKAYSDHLLVNPATGTAKIKLDSWEEATLKEEQQRNDFVCWLRNPSRSFWALCIPYKYNGVDKQAYPDLIIVRKLGERYVIDVLEPHRSDLDDNLGKAKGFAEYARQNPGVGRIQLIRMLPDTIGRKRLRRLDMSLGAVRENVLRATSSEELNHLFETKGFYDDCV